MMTENERDRPQEREDIRDVKGQALLHSALCLLREQSRLLEKRAALQKEFFAFLGKPEPQREGGGESYAECLARLARLHERVFRDIELADPRCLLIFEAAETMESLRRFLPRMEEKGGED